MAGFYNPAAEGEIICHSIWEKTLRICWKNKNNQCQWTVGLGCADLEKLSQRCFEKSEILTEFVKKSLDTDHPVCWGQTDTMTESGLWVLTTRLLSIWYSTGDESSQPETTKPSMKPKTVQ